MERYLARGRGEVVLFAERDGIAGGAAVVVFILPHTMAG